MKRIALIAHDKMKSELVEFVANHLDFFRGVALVSTGHTGALVSEKTDLKVKRYLSGPLGGDQQIGAQIASGKIDAVFFFRDPLTPQPLILIGAELMCRRLLTRRQVKRLFVVSRTVGHLCRRNRTKKMLF